MFEMAINDVEVGMQRWYIFRRKKVQAGLKLGVPAGVVGRTAGEIFGNLRRLRQLVNPKMPLICHKFEKKYNLKFCYFSPFNISTEKIHISPQTSLSDKNIKELLTFGHLLLASLFISIKS